jgi:hypothetical protein
MLFSPCTLIRLAPAHRSPAARQRVKFLLFAFFPLFLSSCIRLSFCVGFDSPSQLRSLAGLWMN